MHTGKIKKIIRDKGFGFISARDGREIFFHQNGIVEGQFDTLTDEHELEFEVEKTHKGPRAFNIRIVKKEVSENIA